ncbi:MAG: methyltransferase domain-containing protein [Proteobacteria bacterium]|nr:methyltransferase domain-containing protein [Pseudomonadota bacterium]
MPNYDKQFYDDIRETSRHAARTIVPMVLELIGSVASVIDIGCGNGIWLSVFREHGAERTLGLDGDHVDRATLEIAEDDFKAADLGQPLPIAGRHDLAMTLEVVEHLPKARAESIVDDLVSLAPVVLFSAAVPGQGGEGHINEEWQDTWAERFERRGYRTLDPIRPKIWRDPSISWWYQQNLLLFASPEAIAGNPNLARVADQTDRARLSVVHPRVFVARHKFLVQINRERIHLVKELAELQAKYDALSGSDDPTEG